MIFVHEISDVKQISTTLPEGIHYAAKKIGDFDCLFQGLKSMLINCLVANAIPAGVKRGRLPHSCVTETYSTVECDLLETAGYNPIILKPINSTDELGNPSRYVVTWGNRFQYERNGRVQPVLIADALGITEEFKDYLMQVLWAKPGTIVTETVELSPLARAVRAQPAQIGTYDRLL